MFSGSTVPPDSKETELGSSNQEASPSAGKNTRVVLVSPLGNSDHVVFSVSIDFPSNSQQDALFYRIAYDNSCANSDLGMMHWQQPMPALSPVQIKKKEA